MSVELGGPLLYSCSLEPSPSLLLTVQLGRWPSRIHRELSSGGHIGLLCRYGNEHSKRKGCCHYCLIRKVPIFVAERWEGVDSRYHVSCERLTRLHKPSSVPSDHIIKNPASTEKDHY